MGFQIHITNAHTQKLDLFKDNDIKIQNITP